jgi:integrase
MAFRKSDAENAKSYLPANATVNRDVIGTLRPVLNRAKKHWGAKGLEEIAWDDLHLKEPGEHIRVYSEAERSAWLAECGPTAGLALQLLLTYGMRFGELFFPLDAFDPEGPRLSISKRKRDVPLVLPLLDSHAAEIKTRLGRARSANLPTIWFVEVVQGGGDTELEPISYYGMQARLRSAAKRAGIKPGRILHGTRHHAGTSILRASKNLKVTQQALGHADIKSTMRYAHALEDDVLAALETSGTVIKVETAKKDRRRAR